MQNQFLKMAIVCIIGTSSACVFSAEKQVEIEVLTDSRTPLDGAHEWLQVLKQLKVDHVRMRAKRASDSVPSIQGNRPQDRTIKVTALLNAKNVLVVPKASFRRSDAAALTSWLAELKKPPAEKPAKSSASKAELIRLRQRMKTAVAGPTIDVSILEFLDDSRDWKASIVIDRTARIPRRDRIATELSGFSQGTAIAIAVRQYGLVAVPEPGGHSLRIMQAGFADQSWPIGWKPEQPLPATVPKLAESLNIEIKGTPLSDVLTAIETKVGIPFVLDHFELRQKGIDLHNIKINVRPRRAKYKRVLDGILVRNFLTGEVRVDEAGKPFYWITALRHDRGKK